MYRVMVSGTPCIHCYLLCFQSVCLVLAHCSCMHVCFDFDYATHYTAMFHPLPCRPTMIKYGISNIRELVGHKVNLENGAQQPSMAMPRVDYADWTLRSCIKCVEIFSL